METNQKSKKNNNQKITVPRFQMLCGLPLENFYQFKRDVEVYFKATGTYSESNEVQVTRLISLLGLEALNVVKVNCKLTCKSVDTILQKLEEHCASIKNVLMEHYKFFTRKQGAHELFDDYFEDLEKLIKNCSFNDNENELLRTQLVIGLYDKKLQERCLKSDLLLPGTLKLCQTAEKSRLIKKKPKKSLDSTRNSEPEISSTENTSQAIEHIDIKPEILINPLDITMEDIIQKISEIEKPEEFGIQAETNGNTLINEFGSTQQFMPRISNSDPTKSNNLVTKKKKKYCQISKKKSRKKKKVIQRLLAELKLAKVL